MKHVLLGTTALVAAGFAASSAHAAQGVQLGIGGYYAAAAGLIFSQDDNNGDPGAHTRDIVFRQDVEVHFKGETTLDNGLTVGAHVELEGENAGDQIDKSFVYWSGGFGKVQIGSQDKTIGAYCLLPPGATANFSAFSPYRVKTQTLLIDGVSLVIEY